MCHIFTNNEVLAMCHSQVPLKPMLGGRKKEEGSVCVCVCFLERFTELTEPTRFIGIYEWFISVTI